MTGSVPANLWRQAILQGHGGAMRLPKLAMRWRWRRRVNLCWVLCGKSPCVHVFAAVKACVRVQELEDELKTVNRRHASNVKVCEFILFQAYYKHDYYWTPRLTKYLLMLFICFITILHLFNAVIYRFNDRRVSANSNFCVTSVWFSLIICTIELHVLPVLSQLM